MPQDQTPLPDRLPPEEEPATGRRGPRTDAGGALRAFVDALRAAGLLAELDDETFARLEARLDDPRDAARRLDLLERYYLVADGDAEAARRRRKADRFMLHRATDTASATALVDRLGALLPDLGEVVLERVGAHDGPLVVRSGEDVVAVEDEDEAGSDTNEIDLRELELGDVETVAVRGLVRAVNALLDRRGIARRLVALRADATREAYVGAEAEAVEGLFTARCLEEPELAAVRAFAGWGVRRG